MKRSIWKRKATVPLKHTKLRRKSKSKERIVQDLLWIECKRIVDEQFGTDCYTCLARNLQGKNKQLGHVLWPKSVLGAYLKYDLRVLRNQCFSCNINHSGMNTEGYKRMLREEGKDYMDKLEEDRKIVVKSLRFYENLLEEYQRIII